MKFVIDSSVFIDYLRRGLTAGQLFDSLEEQNADLFIPTIVIFELFSGKSTKNPSTRSKMSNFIKDFKRVELTEEVAVRAGELYRDIGKHISAQDYIIAASAIEIGATVVTLNTKHFEKVPNLPVYPLKP